MGVRGKITTGLVLVLILGMGFSYFWLSGQIQIRADVTGGCQGTKKVSSFLGRPGTNLVTYNFFGRDLSVNTKITSTLDKVQKDFADAKINYTFDDIDSYNYRSKRGGGGTSMHAWGTAFDVNPQRNPYWGNRAGEMQKDLPDALINVFKQNGFFWGGDWPGNRDPMHFEWYPAGVNGQVVDALSLQVIPFAATFLDAMPTTNAAGQYSLIVPYGKHTVSATAAGYPEGKTEVELGCFTNNNVNVSMQPYSNEVSGSISGHVNGYSRYSFFRPGASVYLNDNLITNVDANGNYLITGVPAGTHTLAIRFLFIQAAESTVTLKPGENATGVDFTVGE